MTLAELNEIYNLISELHDAQRIRESLMAEAHPKSQAITGMPHAPGVKDPVGDLGIELAMVCDEIDRIQNEIDALKPTVEQFISQIDGIQLRVIFRCRYLHGMQWKDVADTLAGGNTVDGVKSAVYRYLDRK